MSVEEKKKMIKCIILFFFFQYVFIFEKVEENIYKIINILLKLKFKDKDEDKDGGVKIFMIMIDRMDLVFLIVFKVKGKDLFFEFFFIYGFVILLYFEIF